MPTRTPTASSSPLVAQNDVKPTRSTNPNVRTVFSVPGALAARTTPGSTGPGPVADQLAAAGDRLAAWRDWAAEPVIPT